MGVVVNGEGRELQVGATVAGVVRSLDLGQDARDVAVALDGEVVIRRRRYAEASTPMVGLSSL